MTEIHTRQGQRLAQTPSGPTSLTCTPSSARIPGPRLSPAPGPSACWPPPRCGARPRVLANGRGAGRSGRRGFRASRQVRVPLTDVLRAPNEPGSRCHYRTAARSRREEHAALRCGGKAGVDRRADPSVNDEAARQCDHRYGAGDSRGQVPAQTITAVSSMAATSPATPGTRSLRSPKSCTRPLMDTRVWSSARASPGRGMIAENTSVP